MLFIKLAILMQIHRIFTGTSRTQVYWLSVSLIVLDVAFYIAAVIVEIAACVPREKIWDPFLPNGTCLDNSVAIVVAGAFNLLLDCLVFALPIYAILHLKIPIKRKVGICAIFAIGLLWVLLIRSSVQVLTDDSACVSSFLRLYYSILLMSVVDVTYNILNLCWTASLELASALLVASFPVMPRLYQYIRGKRPADSTTYPSYRFSFRFGSNRFTPRKARPSIGTLSHENQTVVSAGQERHEWLPLEDQGGYGLPNIRMTGLAKAPETYQPDSLGKREIRRTVTIHTQFEPTYLSDQ